MLIIFLVYGEERQICSRVFRSEDDVKRVGDHVKGMNLDKVVLPVSSSEDMEIDEGARASSEYPENLKGLLVGLQVLAGDRQGGVNLTLWEAEEVDSTP